VPEPTPKQLPGIGLAFQNFEAGKNIFDGWLKRLGHTIQPTNCAFPSSKALSLATLKATPFSFQPTLPTNLKVATLIMNNLHILRFSGFKVRILRRNSPHAGGMWHTSGIRF
jgi:hypothetical protein